MFFAKVSCSLAVFCLALSAFAQATATRQPPAPASPAAPAQSTPAKVEMPSDPAGLLVLAAKMNGLQNVGTQPLHIKATYQLLDDKGGVKETGTFEELYVSARRYKLAYHSPSFNQTEYSTDAGVFRIGDQKNPNTLLTAAHDGLFPKFPSADELSKSRHGFVDRQAGDAQLKCVTLENQKSAPPAPHFAVYCFDRSAPTLRVVETHHGADMTFYNDVSLVLGTYVGREAVFSELGKPQVQIRLDSLGALPQGNQTIEPPADAIKVSQEILKPTAPKVVRPVWPEYAVYPIVGARPELASGANPRLLGKMTISLVVGKNGRVVDVITPSGSSAIVQPAVDAARKWLFQPAMLDGHPVEVMVNIEMPIPE
jgi:hypothetical protein